MKTDIKVSDTRFPRLTRAVIRQIGDVESLTDVALHGADAGWTGFTYYTDTVAFFKAHKADIMALAENLAGDLGEDTLAMIAGFNCLRNLGANFSAYGISEGLSGRGDYADIIRNAMAWFAAEEIARELNPEI